MRHRKSIAEINLKNLKHNFELIQKISSHRKFICPMIKANAYGHGAVEVSKALIEQGTKALGVALIEEAIQLRENQIGTEILVFTTFDKASCDAIMSYKITPVLSQFEELENLKSRLSKNSQQKIHLKFNTGMNRLGFELSEVSKIKNFLDSNQNFKLDGICTHLINGDDIQQDEGFSKSQLEKIFEVSENFKSYPHHLHALNSSALVSSSAQKPPDLQVASLGARPGIALYGGVHPSASLDFRPVMQLKSEVVLLHEVKRGETVSYGGQFKTKRDSLIGVVPFGYGDGYFRSLSNQSEVLCHGHHVPVVGTVCMDYFMIDLTEFRNAENFMIGDEVMLFGQQKNNQILAGDLAKKVGTISYEVFTRVGERVPRIFIR